MHMISWRRVAVGFLGLFLLSVLSVVLLPGPVRVQAAGPGPEERAKVKADIEAQMKVEGRRPLPAPIVKPARPTASRVSTTFTTTKAELLERWEEAWAKDKAYYTELEKNGFKATADAQRKEALDGKRQLEALPDGPNEMTLPITKAGERSANFSPFTYDGNPTVKDPVNVFLFGEYGIPWTVWYLLSQGVPAAQRWEAAYLPVGGGWCGNDQQIYIADADHPGGWNGWQWNAYHLEKNGYCFFGTRFHARLFGSFVPDTHLFGNWTAAAVHYDPVGHACGEDWEGGEWLFKDSFFDHPSQTWHWFVGGVWAVDFGNSGYWNSCNNAHWNDGITPWIWIHIPE